MISENSEIIFTIKKEKGRAIHLARPFELLFKNRPNCF